MHFYSVKFGKKQVVHIVKYIGKYVCNVSTLKNGIYRWRFRSKSKVKTYFHMVSAWVHFTDAHVRRPGNPITRLVLRTPFHVLHASMGTNVYAYIISEGSEGIRKIPTKNVKCREKKSRTYSYYEGDLQCSSWIIVQIEHIYIYITYT